jgi:hypothetical protein
MMRRKDEITEAELFELGLVYDPCDPTRRRMVPARDIPKVNVTEGDESYRVGGTEGRSNMSEDTRIHNEQTAPSQPSARTGELVKRILAKVNMLPTSATSSVTVGAAVTIGHDGAQGRKIKEYDKYRVVMEKYRREEEVIALMEFARLHGRLLDRLLVDQDHRILTGYKMWEAARRLKQENPYLIDDLEQTCVVVKVTGEADARLKIRAAHLIRAGDLRIENYNDVIADQIRDAQAVIDEHLDVLMKEDLRITGRFRLSANQIAKLLGVSNKRVERVIDNAQRYPDLSDLALLPSLDSKGVLQAGRNKPGSGIGRGRKRQGEKTRSDVQQVTRPRERGGPSGGTAGPALADLIRGLRILSDVRGEVRWDSASVRSVWLEAAKRFRAIDEEVAIPVYSFYATGPDTVRYLLDRESFQGEVHEPCAGDGAIVRVLQQYGLTVHASDIRNHPGVCGRGGLDALDLGRAENVVTNPPWPTALRIAEHLIKITQRKVALLMRIELIGGQCRRPFFAANPPARVYPLRDRPVFFAGGDPARKQAGRWDFAWFVWERGFAGETRLIR